MAAITVTTVLRLGDGTTRPITITRAPDDYSWGVVPAGYTGRRCRLCDMPHHSNGLCHYHVEQLIWHRDPCAEA